MQDKKWYSLTNDLMGKIILSDVKFVKHFIMCVTDYICEDLEDMEIISGKELIPEVISNNVFRTDVVIKLKNNDYISIEIQRDNTTSAMIKNELYAYKIILNQKVKKGKYENINKLTGIVVILNNYIIPKKKRVLLEHYDKSGVIDREHKLMKGYFDTIIYT